MITKYVGAYMIIENLIASPIPIISVTTTAVANAPAVAAVHVHPNPYIYKLTRGINIFIVCMVKNTVEGRIARHKVMFIGDISSIQMVSNSTKTEYVINLVDNRRYIEEQPSYYLKLIRSKREMSQPGGMHQRVNASGETIISIYDELADANFYGIPGHICAEDKVYYDIDRDGKGNLKDKAIVSTVLMETWYANGIYGYWAKMTSCLRADSGWEPYYINMNKKKRIIAHHTIVDNGIFANALERNKKVEAQLSGQVKTTHAGAEWNVTYEDAMRKFADLGYVYNTSLFPHMAGGQEESLTIGSIVTADKDIMSTLFKGTLLGYIITDTDSKWVDQYRDAMKEYPASEEFWGEGGTVAYNVREDKYIELYEKVIGKKLCIAAINKANDDGSDKPRIAEFYLIPKYYGVIPPPCNWNTLRSGVTLNLIINEPPLTALKYNLRLSGVGISYMAVAYPNTLKVYVNKPWGADDTEGFEAWAEGQGGKIVGRREAFEDLQGDGYVSRILPQDDINEAPSRVIELGSDYVVTDTSSGHWHREGKEKSMLGGVDISVSDTNQYTQGKSAFNSRIPIHSFSQGEIVMVDYSAPKKHDRGTTGGYGNCVVVLETIAGERFVDGKTRYSAWFYCHLKPIMSYIPSMWSPGRTIPIDPGTQLGWMGNTGYTKGGAEEGVHLHLMVMYFGWENPKTKGWKTFKDWRDGGTDWKTVCAGKALGKYVNISWLFNHTKKDVPYVKNKDGTDTSVLTVPLSNLTDYYFSYKPSSSTTKKKTAVTSSKGSDVIGEEITEEQYPHNPLEDVYGVKRVSKESDATDMLTMMDASDLPRDQQYAVLREKVRNDFYESQVSRNTGTITIQGLDERAMVGLPYLIYHPGHEIFYYGSVAEVSHRIDNNGGAAYTEISLINIRPFTNIRDIEKDFIDYGEGMYNSAAVGDAEALKNLNALWVKITGCAVSRYNKKSPYEFLSTASGGAPNEALSLHTMGQRPPCTIQQIMNYMYNNKTTLSKHDAVATDIYGGQQWVTTAMANAINNVIDYYRQSLKSANDISLSGMEELQDKADTNDPIDQMAEAVRFIPYVE